MRIHTNDLVMSDVIKAATLAEATIAEINEHRSKTHTRAFEVKLRGNSARYPQAGRDSSDARAATWDQWGLFLGFLFAWDWTIKTLPYPNVGEFHLATDWRFDTPGMFSDPLNHDHRWEYIGVPRMNECRTCGAVRRWEVAA